jgi:aspartyl-tRNA(Asn)/glutamyl-tRNA(Gln) amidotransferase subunit A
MELTKLALAELQQQLQTRKVMAREVTEAHLKRIEERDPKTKAFLSLCPERAFAQADAIDQRIGKGEALPPLAGLPLAVKDAIMTRDVSTTAGSRILEGYVPPYSATAVERLEQAGAITLGKTNCDEFAMGSSTENSGYFPTHNPRDLERVPGGSSGGSAAAVADGMCVAALGTPAGPSGSRQPFAATWG